MELALQKKQLAGVSGVKNESLGKTGDGPRGDEVFLKDVVFGLKM